MSSQLLTLLSLFIAPMDGVWRTQGYGLVFQIKGPELQAYEVTRTTCVKGFTARRDTATVPGRELTFTSTDGQVLFVRPGGTDDHKVLHNDGSASDMRV